MIELRHSGLELPQTQSGLNHKLQSQRSPDFDGPHTQHVGSESVQSEDQKTHYEEDSEFAETLLNMESRLTARNTFIFGVLLIITQITFCLVYGFSVSLPTMPQAIDLNFGNFTVDLSPSEIGQSSSMAPVVLTSFTTLACFVGLSLLTAYNKKLVWSSLGMNLLISCLTIEMYLVTNNLIARIGSSAVQKQAVQFKIYLSNFEDHVDATVNNGALVENYGNTLIEAVKASFANCVLYSCILGRAGFIQAYFVSLFGTIGFTVCKIVFLHLGVDFGDACSIFVFGGTTGLVVGFFLLIKYRRQVLTSTKKHELNTANVNSIAFSVIGSAVLTALLPVIVSHPSRSQIKRAFCVFLMAPYSIYLSATSAVLCSAGVSIIINQKLNIRDFVNSPIAGAIAALCSSYFIATPVYSQIVGAVAGITQAIVQNTIETRIAREYEIVTTYSFCLFGVQGLIGAAFGSIFKFALSKDLQLQSSFNVIKMKELAEPALLGIIAVGVGVIAGTFISTSVILLSVHNRADHFLDKIYWGDIEDDLLLEEDSKQILFEAQKDIYKPEHII